MCVCVCVCDIHMDLTEMHMNAFLTHTLLYFFPFFIFIFNYYGSESESDVTYGHNDVIFSVTNNQTNYCFPRYNAFTITDNKMRRYYNLLYYYHFIFQFI